MSFLTPLFLVGLAAAAIPVLIHLIQRERKNVVPFPSLMFLRRIPYESVRRRRIHNWLLLALRLAAIALIVSAFARPFLKRANIAGSAAGGAREVVVLIDRSYSMGYGDRWQRARAAAREAVGGLGASDRASVVFFSSGAEVALRSTTDRGRLATAIDLHPNAGAGATRYGPALKLAGSILSESGLPRREVILVSDFQRAGWQGAQDVRLPDGATLTPIAIADAHPVNVSVAPVTLQRSTFSGQERLTVTASALNRGDAAAPNVPLTLEIDGRAVQTKQVSLEANGSGSVTFDAFTPAARNTRGAVRVATDALAADNAFHFIVSPKQPLKVFIAERPGASGQPSLYLSRALALGEAPPFDVQVKPVESLSIDDVQRAAIVVLNDVPVSQFVAERLARFVERGGGLLVTFGERATWPSGIADILPATPGAPVDRTKGSAARLGTLDYGHAVFEPFRAPRSGDFSGARFYGYRSVTMAPGARILARFDDGAPALMERRIGSGRVLAWASSLDLGWNDLALKPVFLPFVHRIATTLASYAERPAWVTVGDVLEPERRVPVPGGSKPYAPRVVLTPSGERVTLDEEGPEVLELSEPGFYEVRAQGKDAEAATTVASNVDLAESDLTTMDPNDVAAAATGHAGGGAASGANATPSDEEQERAQRLWWTLLFAGLLLLGAETVLANRQAA
jgi:hypothetical protein